MASYLMDLIKTTIEANAPMSLEKILEKELSEWLASDKRAAMIKGDEYYAGKQDILEHYRYAIGKDGRRIRLHNLPNAQIVDNQYSIAVDKKVNFSFGQPFTIVTESEDLQKLLSRYMGRTFMRMLRRVAADCLKGGIGYLYPYYNDLGEFKFKRLQNWDVLPFYADGDKEEVDAFLFLHEEIEYQGQEKHTKQMVDFYDATGIRFYEYKDGHLIPRGTDNQITTKDKKGLNWKHLPLIPFRYNVDEQPLLARIKSLQDAINTILSIFQNNMEEDARTTILVLHNYDGTDLGEFRELLAQYGAVKVADDGQRKGGVDTLNIEVNAENYKAILATLKAALIENARSFDAKDERVAGGDPNQLKIKSMLLDMEMDANGMETEFQPALQMLSWFCLQDAANRSRGKFDSDEVEFEFNRDNLTSETEVIQNMKALEGIISKRTLLEQCPWVDNVDAELKRLEEERQEAMDELFNERGMFPPGGIEAPDNDQQEP